MKMCQKINEHKLDVALRFGFRILRGKVLKQLHTGSGPIIMTTPCYIEVAARFLEVMKDDAVTGSVLQILLRNDNGRLSTGRGADYESIFSEEEQQQLLLEVVGLCACSSESVES